MNKDTVTVAIKFKTSYERQAYSKYHSMLIMLQIEVVSFKL